MAIHPEAIPGSVVSTPAVGALLTRPRTGGGDDPAGVRNDFPIVKEKLPEFPPTSSLPRSARFTRPGCAFLEAKTRRPVTLSRCWKKPMRSAANSPVLVGVSPDEIGFLSSTSEGREHRRRLARNKPGDNVVVDDLHYSTSYALYRHLESSRGVELRIAKNRDGR